MVMMIKDDMWKQITRVRMRAMEKYIFKLSNEELLWLTNKAVHEMDRRQLELEEKHEIKRRRV